MTKLSDTQSIILAEASQRADGNLLPLPGSLRGGALAKVIGALLRRGLIEERTIDSIQPPDASLNRVWRQDDDGRAILLYITEAGLASIGCEPEDAGTPGADAEPEAVPYAMLEGTNSAGEPAAGATDDATDGATDAPKAKAGRKGGSRRKGDGAAPKAKGKAKGDAKVAPSPRTGTKQEKLISMLRTPEGASIDEIVAATGWQPHTIRGAIAGALKKKLGLMVTSEKVEGRGRVYRIGA